MPSKQESELLTIAAVRDGRDGQEILFNERQQIFTLPAKVRSAKGVADLIKTGISRKIPVTAALETKKGVVEKIEPADAKRIEMFRKEHPLEAEAARSVKIDVKKIDPTTFNIVDLKLRWSAFLLCKKVIPNYAKAKEIFDYCAGLSCHLPGPYDTTPCIPFQYVRDGCYARAHKMRRIITTKFGYCCEKVFSFANQGQDRLAVKADKWGGCCVTWWYHVAPLVRVNVKIFNFNIVLAMVIDPGMFNHPVLLSKWLAAQENTGCDRNANVSMYSIQPGSAYSPANYAGTAFSTDPNYTSTDATLIAYKNLKTC